MMTVMAIVFPEGQREREREKGEGKTRRKRAAGTNGGLFFCGPVLLLLHLEVSRTDAE